MNEHRPSSTALLIARSLIFLACERHGSRLVDATSLALALACLKRAGVNSLRWWRICKSPSIRRIIWSVERLLLPGIVRHYALRKNIIYQQALSATQSGIKNVIVIAAGYDALTWRLAKRGEKLELLEADHPRTQAIKRDAFRASSTHIDWKPCDLSRDALSSLLSSPQLPCLVVMEGVLMYFDAEHVARMLTDVATHLAPGSQLICTVMMYEDNAHIKKPHFAQASPWIDAWLAHSSEPFRWGIARSEISSFFARCGLRVRSILDEHDLAQAVQPNRVAAKGEVVICSIRD